MKGMKGLYRKSPGKTVAESSSTHLPTVVKQERVLNAKSPLLALDRLVVLTILDRMWKPFPNGLYIAYMSLQDIADRSGASIRSVIRTLQKVCASEADRRFASADPIFLFTQGGQTRYGQQHSYPQFILAASLSADDLADWLSTDDGADSPDPDAVPLTSCSSTAVDGPSDPSSAPSLAAPTAAPPAPSTFTRASGTAPPVSMNSGTVRVESPSSPGGSIGVSDAAAGGPPSVKPERPSPAASTPEEVAERQAKDQRAWSIVSAELQPKLDLLKWNCPVAPPAYHQLKGLYDSLRYPNEDRPHYVSDVTLLPVVAEVNYRLVACGLADTLQGRALAQVVRALSEMAAARPKTAEPENQ